MTDRCAHCGGIKGPDDDLLAWTTYTDETVPEPAPVRLHTDGCLAEYMLADGHHPKSPLYLVAVAAMLLREAAARWPCEDMDKGWPDCLAQTARKEPPCLPCRIRLFLEGEDV